MNVSFYWKRVVNNDKNLLLQLTGDRLVVQRKKLPSFCTLRCLLLHLILVSWLTFLGPNLTENSFREPKVTLVENRWFFISYFRLNGPNNFEGPKVVSSIVGGQSRMNLYMAHFLHNEQGQIKLSKCPKHQKYIDLCAA